MKLSTVIIFVLYSFANQANDSMHDLMCLAKIFNKNSPAQNCPQDIGHQKFKATPTEPPVTLQAPKPGETTSPPSKNLTIKPGQSKIDYIKENYYKDGFMNDLLRQIKNHLTGQGPKIIKVGHKIDDCSPQESLPFDFSNAETNDETCIKALIYDLKIQDPETLPMTHFFQCQPLFCEDDKIKKMERYLENTNTMLPVPIKEFLGCPNVSIPI
jgi:hypothetical protein